MLCTFAWRSPIYIKTPIYKVLALRVIYSFHFCPVFVTYSYPQKIFKIESDRHTNTRISSPIIVRITVVVHIARVRSVAAIHR